MGLQVGGRMTDLMDTTCSTCGRGIFAGQPRAWSRKPLGLSHIECLATAPPVDVAYAIWPVKEVRT